MADLQYFFLGIMFHLECQDRVDCPAGETSVGCNRRFFLQYGALLGAIDIRGSQPRRQHHVMYANIPGLLTIDGV